MDVLDTKAINSRQNDFDKFARTKSHFSQVLQEFPDMDFKEKHFDGFTD
jgi:hypothetical protein